ncbi:leucyl aminopeptidase [Solimonas aquatica]|uniref:Probable cytosol aminopeptidase n=1 Tax=Solimonas aquatica TaxID=489703 RepID=A0A1H9AN31_9GAMM|nr:leucyl aminopeptidase [Solimonas aquatica]SEP77867.1 leucyl aminopeptidase [Solimonas aquatica]
MEYFVKSGSPEKQRVACVIVGIFDRRSPSTAAAAIEEVSDGAIASVMRRGDMDGKLGATLLLHNVPGIFADRVLLVGLGKERNFDEAAYRRVHVAAARALRNTGAIDAVSYLSHLPVKSRDFHWNVQQAVLATEDSYYRFDDCRGEKAREEITPPKLERYTFDVPRRSDLPAGERGLAEALAIAKGVALTKNLGNLPGNLCTPTYLAEQAKKMPAPIKAKVLEKADMERLGMGALLSVAKGSSQPPKLIVMEYLKGKKGEKPIALVGKGLTFDAGGISIKPAAGMDEMKFDMCGGASVFGALLAIAELKLPVNVVGVIAATENLLNGEANKPGDIVTSMAGITIEVLNTDAEGRLILCDALTYVEREYEPSLCIDMATLTGACVVALGSPASGLFTNTPALGRALIAAGEQSGDRVWELPLWSDYDDNIKSEFADIANIATRNGKEAGAIIGATFLHRFTRKMKWAHLDIAGTAWVGKKASGRPVPLLVQYLLNLVAKQDDNG